MDSFSREYISLTIGLAGAGVFLWSWFMYSEVSDSLRYFPGIFFLLFFLILTAIVRWLLTSLSCAYSSAMPLLRSPASKGAALITGGSGGIGRAIAEVLLEDGWKQIILVARASAQLDDTRDKLAGRFPSATVTAVACDLANPANLPGLHTKVKSELGVEVDLLVNNAGLGVLADFALADYQKTMDQLQVNMAAVVGLSRLFLPDMLHRRCGALVHISSVGAFQPCPRMAVYAASKSFVTAFSDALAFELRGTGVQCLQVCPGPVGTEFGTRAGNENTRAMKYLQMQTPRAVAEETYTALKKGKHIHVTGTHGGSVAFSAVLPTSVALALSKWFVGKA